MDYSAAIVAQKIEGGGVAVPLRVLDFLGLKQRLQKRKAAGGASGRFRQRPVYLAGAEELPAGIQELEQQ